MLTVRYEMLNVKCESSWLYVQCKEAWKVPLAINLFRDLAIIPYRQKDKQTERQTDRKIDRREKEIILYKIILFCLIKWYCATNKKWNRMHLKFFKIKILIY